MCAAACHAASPSALEAPGRRGPGADRKGAPRRRLDGWGAALDATRLEHVLLVFLAFAAVVPLLHIGRSADGNALTSWRWTSSGAWSLRAIAVLVPGTAAALAASRASLRARVRPALVACLAGAAILPLWAEPEVILDASRYLVQARYLEEYGVLWFLREWGRGIDAWTDLPLVPFLYGAVFSIAGVSRPWAQALDTSLFAATALLVFHMGRTLWDEETGLGAALLLVGSPYLLVLVPLLLVDVPAMFFLSLFSLAFLAAVRKGGAIRILACALAASAAALAKYSLWPMVLAVAAATVAGAGAPRGRVLARAAAVLAATSLAVGAAVAARPDVFARQVGLLAGFQWSGLGRWQEGFLSTFLFQAHPFLAGLALLGALRAAAARDARFLLAGVPLLLALAVGSVRARYAIPLLPFVALAASRGLAAVRDRGARRFVALCVVATSLAVAYGAYLPFIRGISLANLAAAGRYLDALDAPAVEVRASPQRRSSGSTFAAIPLLGYATRKRIVCPEAWALRGEGAAARTSSLRFSWELRRPPFLAGPAPGGDAPVVVVSGDPPAGASPLPGLRERASFAAASGVFEYRTFVTVYAREEGT